MPIILDFELLHLRTCPVYLQVGKCQINVKGSNVKNSFCYFYFGIHLVFEL